MTVTAGFDIGQALPACVLLCFANLLTKLAKAWQE